MTDQLKKALLLMAFATAGLLALPFLLESASIEWLAQEDGPVEMASALMWFAAGALLLGRNLRARRLLPVAFALVMFLMGVREMGLSPEWMPSGGKALMSWRYYADADIDPMRRLITGSLIVLLLVSLIASVVATVRYVFKQEGWRYADAQLLLLAFACLVLGQLAEAGASHDLASLQTRLSWVIEEGYEALGALFALVACLLPRIWLFRPTAAARA